MMRRSAVLFVPATLALVGLTALPAAAAGDEWVWVEQNHHAWTSGAWELNGAPSAGSPQDNDYVTIPLTTAGVSDLNYNVTLDRLTFTGVHTLNNAGGALTLNGGASNPETLRVDGSPAAAWVWINVGLTAVGDQTWIVAPQNVLDIAPWITVDAASELTLHVDGTLFIRGNIDGQVTGLVHKTGVGTVVRSGGAGGAIGGDGLKVERGQFILDDAEILGTDFHVVGGALMGAGAIGHVLVEDDGWLSSQDGYGGGDVGGVLSVKDATFAGGYFGVEILGADGLGDLLRVTGTLSGSGTTLDVLAYTAPEEGESYVVIDAAAMDPAFRLNNLGGGVLEEGDEFEQNGARWSISYADNKVTLTYLGVVEDPEEETPEQETPETPSPRPDQDVEDDEELVATGVADGMSALAAGAGIALVAGAALLFAVRRRRSTT